MMRSFKDRVREVVAAIPKGEVMTYGEVARRAGHPNAARAVGAIMRGNFNPDIPCHRVVGATSLGGYNRGVELKRQRLKEEGYAGV
jgi:methylated-DNA-[protein]-cysteine S-methyltransferase